MSRVGLLVAVRAIGRRGRVGELAPSGQCRVDFPDGRWGWHAPAELEEAPGFDFEAEALTFGSAVAGELRAERADRRPLAGPDLADLAEPLET